MRNAVNWRHWLRVHSNEPSFLWKMCLGIAILGGILGMFVRLLPSGNTPLAQKLMAAAVGEDAKHVLDAFSQHAQNKSVSVEEIMDAVAFLASWEPFVSNTALVPRKPIATDQFKADLAKFNLDEDVQKLAHSLWESSRAGEPTEFIVEQAESKKAPFANYALATFQHHEKNYDKAAQAYLREAQLFGSSTAGKRAIALLASTGQFDRINDLKNDPKFQPYISPRIRLKSLVAQRRWWAVWWTIPSILLERLTLAAGTLAFLTGMGWYLFLIQAGQWWEPGRTRWWLCLIGVGLGILSIWPTDFLIFFQEAMGLEDSIELRAGLKYYVLGVGFREELSKLLLLLPLMPLIVRRRSELEALMVSASVGLGFAVLENAGYFSSSMGSTTGRFLTANFVHMSLTGLTGLAVARACWHGGQRIGEAVATFVIAILVHAWYDALIVLPAIAEYSFANTILFILLAYQFFRELRPMRKRIPEPISLTAVFLGCLSLVISATFVFFSYEVGVIAAMAIMSMKVVAMALMVYMFLREMPNSIISV